MQIGPGTADASFDFTILDREVGKAVKNGKLYSLAIKAGDDGTPAWLFTNGVTALTLQDSGSFTASIAGGVISDRFSSPNDASTGNYAVQGCG